jgi:hypothetical protein
VSPEDHFSEEIAARYDDPSDGMFQLAAIEPVVDFLAALAGDGAAVELGIGTGRIALPLAQRGVEVHGINTINNLTTQEAQVACFENAAAHLEPGGHFVIEVGVPQLQRLPPGETVRPFTLTPTHLGFDEFDVANQGLISHHYELVDGEWRAHSVPFRYVWPSELDLMARLARMTLVERWSGWRREPFTSDSTSHVSVWRRQQSVA